MPLRQLRKKIKLEKVEKQDFSLIPFNLLKILSREPYRLFSAFIMIVYAWESVLLWSKSHGWHLILNKWF